MTNLNKDSQHPDAHIFILGKDIIPLIQVGLGIPGPRAPHATVTANRTLYGMGEVLSCRLLLLNPQLNLVEDSCDSSIS